MSVLSRAPHLHQLQQKLREHISHPIMASSPVVREMHARGAPSEASSLPQLMEPVVSPNLVASSLPQNQKTVSCPANLPAVEPSVAASLLL